MNLTITGRHVSVPDNFREYVDKKIDKLEKYFHQVIDIKIIIYKEKVDYFSEMVLFADGVQFHGIEKGGDWFSAYDLLMDKLEQQVKKHKEKHQQHKGVPLGELPIVDLSSEDGVYIGIKEVGSKPIDEIEAYLQMKIDKKDFILFKKGIKESSTDIDYQNKNYALIYKVNDSLRMVEVPLDKLKDLNSADSFDEFSMTVKNGDSSNPDISMDKTESKVKRQTINEALTSLIECDTCYYPFFNSETNVFNILSTKGNKIEVYVPER